MDEEQVVSGELHILDYGELWQPSTEAFERLAIALHIPYGEDVRGDASVTIGTTTVRIADLINALAQFIEAHDHA